MQPRQRVIDGDRFWPDPQPIATRALLGDRQRHDPAPRPARRSDRFRRDGPDPGHRDIVKSCSRSEHGVHGDQQLERRIVAVDVERRIGLGDAATLSIRQCLREIGPGFQAPQDVLARSVEDAFDAGDPLAREARC
jgi:hypothetical protein